MNKSELRSCDWKKKVVRESGDSACGVQCRELECWNLMQWNLSSIEGTMTVEKYAP
jgi:hypothetical protein